MSLNRILYVTMLGIAISLSVLVAVPVNDQAYALKYPYKAALSGQNEVPPVQTSASGSAEFKAPANDTIKYKINITGIFNVTGAHIHPGKSDERRDPIVDLLQPGMSKYYTIPNGMVIRGNITDSSLIGPMKGKTLADLVSAMNAGDTYSNIHTPTNPKGEIRGQIGNVENTNSTNTNVGFSTLTE